jgi:hypothetical protein
MNVMDGGHYTLETLGSTYRFVFPYRKEWFLILSYGVAGVLAVAFFIPIGLNSPPGNGLGQLGTLDVVLNGFFVVILGLMLVELLWQLAGKEVVEVSDEAVILRHQILGLGPSKRFSVDQVGGLFVSPPDTWATGRGARRDYRFWNFKRGHVGLNSAKSPSSQPDTYRFGTGLDENEAGQVVAQILGRFPQYRPKPEN